MSDILCLEQILVSLRETSLSQLGPYDTYIFDLVVDNSPTKVLLTRQGYSSPIWIIKEMQYPYRCFSEADYGPFNLEGASTVPKDKI